MNDLMQATLDAGGTLVLTVGRDNYADLEIKPAEKDTEDAR